MEKRRHLTPGHVPRWTESVIRGRVTPLRDPGRAQAVDVGLEDRGVVIDEQVPATIVGVAECPDEERCHLASRHFRVLAEPIVRSVGCSLS